MQQPVDSNSKYNVAKFLVLVFRVVIYDRYIWVGAAVLVIVDERFSAALQNI